MVDNIKSLYVAGSFDDKGGRPSKIGEKIFNGINPTNVDYYNGGSFQEIEQIIKNIADYQLIYWFANVLNDEDKPKLVLEIKKKNKACVLVTSKRNLEGKYTFHDLLYHSLGIKSNLFGEVTKGGDRYRGRVIDPLGNVFLNYNDDFSLVGKVLGKRANELLNYTRVPSNRIGDKIEAPDKKLFFEIIMKYGNVFHGLVHARPEAANRFFGNASFKSDDLIFVTRRNIDKREINKDGFVGVKQELPVKYFGDHKPSVDTPIQINLYHYYPDIKFMLHSHTYIENAPFTNRIIPCGALEEAEEIKNLFPEKNNVNFFVNLRGHGSLALVDRVKQLEEIPYKKRDMPEVHDLKWI